LAYLRREEWAESAEDVLWRRSKLGLRFDAGARDRLAQLLGG
jgi:glycerol-3-phosphate dehydrogenase